MADVVKIAFQRRVILVSLAEIIPMRRVPVSMRQTLKYKRIVTSIAEIGIVEPLVVAPHQDGSGSYMLVDGHLRHSALLELGNTRAPCLITDDDEAFTYNKRVNRLATVQEHYMIVRALDRGVSEERLARALNIDMKLVKMKRSLLDGICAEVVDMLKDKSIEASVFTSLRKMKPVRQIEAVELMAMMNNFTARYAQALLAATRQEDLARPERSKNIRGLTPEQMARMEREMEALQREFNSVEASYGDSVLNLVVASGYLSKLIGNPQIGRFLERHHPEILAEFKLIVAASSLEDMDAPAEFQSHGRN